MLKMKYFVLKPRSKTLEDPWARAARAAMRAFADSIERADQSCANDLRAWARHEDIASGNVDDAPQTGRGA